jgi:hypothetical protein
MVGTVLHNFVPLTNNYTNTANIPVIQSYFYLEMVQLRTAVYLLRIILSRGKIYKMYYII